MNDKTTIPDRLAKLVVTPAERHESLRDGVIYLNHELQEWGGGVAVSIFTASYIWQAEGEKGQSVKQFRALDAADVIKALEEGFDDYQAGDLGFWEAARATAFTAQDLKGGAA